MSNAFLDVRHRLLVDDVLPFELLNAAHSAADANREAFGREHRIIDGHHAHPGVPLASALIRLPLSIAPDPDAADLMWAHGRWVSKPQLDHGSTMDPLAVGTDIVGIVFGRIRFVRVAVSRFGGNGGAFGLPVSYVNARNDMFRVHLGFNALAPSGWTHSTHLVDMQLVAIWVYGENR